tara:strand:- start:22142 stop:22762 length:621 start_codon:yes stop_codon:yes gene_type:complete
MIYIEFDIWNNVTKCVYNNDSYEQKFIGKKIFSYEDNLGNYWDSNDEFKFPYRKVKFKHDFNSHHQDEFEIEVVKKQTRNIKAINVVSKTRIGIIYGGTEWYTMSSTITVGNMGTPTIDYPDTTGVTISQLYNYIRDEVRVATDSSETLVTTDNRTVLNESDAVTGWGSNEHPSPVPTDQIITLLGNYNIGADTGGYLYDGSIVDG